MCNLVSCLAQGHGLKIDMQFSSQGCVFPVDEVKDGATDAKEANRVKTNRGRWWIENLIAHSGNFVQHGALFLQLVLTIFYSYNSTL